MSNVPAGVEPGQRAAWVDAARCMAMFFIIWLHAGAAPGWVGEVVGGAICLFYVLAGYFMPQVPGSCARRAGRLLLAWLLWSVLSAGLALAVEPGAGFSWARFVGLGAPAYNTPLWFLRNLALYQLVVALSLWLRVLPGYVWWVVVLLLGCAYAVEPAQHVGLRFDHLWWVVLGVGLRGVPLAGLRLWLGRYAWLLVGGGVFLLVQPYVLDAVLGVAWRRSALPVAELVAVVGFCVAGVLGERFCPQVVRCMVPVGRCMFFSYAAHSFMLAPLYAGWVPAFAWNVWVPLPVLLLLTWLCLLGQRCFPRVLALFLAR